MPCTVRLKAFCPFRAGSKLAQPCEDDVLHHVWFLLLLSALCYHRRMTPHDQQRFGRITLVGLIIAIFGVAFMFGGHPVISALLLLLAWVLVVLDEDIRSG